MYLIGPYIIRRKGRKENLHLKSITVINPVTRMVWNNDGVQPKMSPFSTRHIIWVKYKVANQLSRPIYLSFSYLNSARHFSVIELCRGPLFINFCCTVLEKIDLQFFAVFFAFFYCADFHIYFSRELTFLWINKTISSSK